jgi:protein-tyrosine phosphatase
VIYDIIFQGVIDMVNVLFICLGNICRSPMAEGLFKDQIKKLGLEKEIHVESRATSGWEEGNPVHSGTKKILSNLNIDTSNMISTKIQKKDFQKFDYLICMDQNNVDQLIRIDSSNGHKVYLYLDIITNHTHKSISDPYYTHDFKQTYDDIVSAMDLWIKKFKVDLNID